MKKNKKAVIKAVKENETTLKQLIKLKQIKSKTEALIRKKTK